MKAIKKKKSQVTELTKNALHHTVQYCTTVYFNECFLIFCIDILNGAFREDIRLDDHCSAENRFIFNWSSLAMSQQEKLLPLEKSVLRAHLNLIPRLLDHSTPTNVTVNIYMNLVGRNAESEVHTATHTLALTRQSTPWVELNITKGVQALWPPQISQSEVEVRVRFSVSCPPNRRVPASFENPATIPLNQKKRERRLPRQPLFVVELSDEAVKEIVKSESVVIADDDYNFGSTTTMGGQESSDDRRKRSTVPACRLEDFHINFNDLQLNYVLLPQQYNAKQCRGSCSHTTLSLSSNSYLATNHAKLLASADVLSRIDPNLFPHQDPKPPCCVPSKYSAQSLVISSDDKSLKYVLYPHMIVEECRCR